MAIADLSGSDWEGFPDDFLIYVNMARLDQDVSRILGMAVEQVTYEKSRSSRRQGSAGLKPGKLLSLFIDPEIAAELEAGSTTGDQIAAKLSPFNKLVIWEQHHLAADDLTVLDLETSDGSQSSDRARGRVHAAFEFRDSTNAALTPDVYWAFMNPGQLPPERRGRPYVLVSHGGPHVRVVVPVLQQHFAWNGWDSGPSQNFALKIQAMAEGRASSVLLHIIGNLVWKPDRTMLRVDPLVIQLDEREPLEVWEIFGSRL